MASLPMHFLRVQDKAGKEFLLNAAHIVAISSALEEDYAGSSAASLVIAYTSTGNAFVVRGAVGNFDEGLIPRMSWAEWATDGRK